ELVMSGGVAFTLGLGIGFAALVWNRNLRWVMIVAAVVLHVGIAVTMGLTTFGLMMLSLLLAFVPPSTVHWVSDRVVEQGARRLGLGPGAPPPAGAVAA